MPFRCATCLVLALPTLAAAADISADPADSGVAVPAIRYESPFAGYRPFPEQTLAPWREVNDEVQQGTVPAGMQPASPDIGAATGAASSKTPASVTVRKPATTHQH
jgi:hypothetical protein